MGKKAMQFWIRASVSLLAAALAFGGQGKLAKDLENLVPESTVDVIIQYKQAPSERHHKKVTGRGGVYKRDLSMIRAGHYSVPARDLAELENDPDVVAISPDREVRGTMDVAAPTINATIANNNTWTGAGIGVAVIDSGIDGPDVNGRVVYSQNFVPGESDALDHYGHGTHIAGILAGSGGLSNGKYKGIAGGVKLINLRVLDTYARGTDSAVIAAIQRAIALKSTYNIRVINLSLGRPVASSYVNDPLCQAVEAAWSAGIVVVVAAGNEGRNQSQNTDGYGTITAPGNDPYVITVGAMKPVGTTSRSDDRIASYSSKGPTLLDHIVKPDLVAPGNRIVSVKLNMNSPMESQYPQNEVQDDYFILSGTSMATPMVSGAAAMVLQKYPSLTPDQVKARLMKTATKAFPPLSTATDPATGRTYTSQYDIFTVGAGYLDVWAALNNTDTSTLPALSPTAVYDASTKTVKLVTGNSVVWGSSVIWGSSVVWGSSAFVSGTSVIWGSSVVWGASSMAGFSVVWGNSVVWGAGQAAAESTAIAINGEN